MFCASFILGGYIDPVTINEKKYTFKDGYPYKVKDGTWNTIEGATVYK